MIDSEHLCQEHSTIFKHNGVSAVYSPKDETEQRLTIPYIYNILSNCEIKNKIYIF